MKTNSDGYGFVSISRLNVYGKCGVPEDARKVFDNMLDKNVFTWNSMIVSNDQNGFYEEAIRMFLDM
uniref:Pentatricopeptide repeat-containing protein n=1 Tax=Rhizophora mucronata TaxID=61149 RepID=A0A2P2MV04_RHIMU